MTKESVLKGISEGSWFALKSILIIFFIAGIIINVFLGIVIIGKLYDIETALELTKIIGIFFKGLMYLGLTVSVLGIVAELILSLKKSNEKFKEKKKKEFEGFVNKIIEKTRRKK